MQCTGVRQQWLVAGWLGPSVTVRVKVRARVREWCFSLLFFLKSDISVYCHRTSRDIPGHLTATLDNPRSVYSNAGVVLHLSLKLKEFSAKKFCVN